CFGGGHVCAVERWIAAIGDDRATAQMLAMSVARVAPMALPALLDAFAQGPGTPEQAEAIRVRVARMRGAAR
ncbi:MAG: hypothetical protein AAFY59_19780, partial [Pseudomonadota bacterium]